MNEPASSGTDVNSGGQPDFDVSDIQSINTPGYQQSAPIKVKQPRIYFGELISKVNPDYAIVGSANGQQTEYDTPNSRYTYSGGPASRSATSSTVWPTRSSTPSGTSCCPGRSTRTRRSSTTATPATG